MKVIAISGIIARWEMSSESNVTPETLRRSLDDAAGESVRIDINSPGGDVNEGLEMFNMIKNYSGHTETRIVAMAASMGSVISLAGDKRTAEKTASYMIHNPWGIGIGDFRDFRKRAERLEMLRNHLSNVYTDRAGIDNSEVKEMMNDETWFYGSDISDFGFEIVDSESNSSFDEMKVSAHARYDSYVSHLKEHPEIVENDLEKAAASIAGTKTKNQTSKPPAANAGENNNNEEKISVKTLDELKAQFPELHAAALQAGKDQAMDTVTAHLNMGEASGDMALAVKNIKEGKEMNQTVQSEYMAAGMKNQNIKDRNDDNPEDLGTEGSGDLDSGDDEADTKAYADKLKNQMGGKK